MKLDDLIATIAKSAASDWTKIDRPIFLQDHQQVSGGGHPLPWIEIDEHHTLLSYREDLRISIATGITHLKDFSAPWANKHPDPRASSDWVDFLYNGRPVLRELIVWVDGGRSGLPVPPIGSNKISDLQYRIWSLINELTSSADFDNYLSRTGFDVEDFAWPR
jgi:hypothetical protein